MKIVFLTGGNGFVGTQIARYLLENKTVKILALVRACNEETARHKLEREWWGCPELVGALGKRIEPVCGDVCQPRLGLNEETYYNLAETVTHIIHAAADVRLSPLNELRITNVQGTETVLDFAEEANKHGQFERYSHISTAYVAGAKTGIVDEESLSDECGFFTDYEKSKYEGEQLVKVAKSKFPVSVFRPSMIVGDSQTGAIKIFNTIYFPLRLYLTGKLNLLTVSRHLKINIVPVDYVAKSIVQLTFDEKAAGQNFHLVAPHESLPTLEDLMNFVQKWAEAEIGIKLRKPTYIKMSASSMKRLLRLQQAFKGGNDSVSNALISLAPYFSENRQIRRENVDRLLGPYKMTWQEIFSHVLEYAVYHSFFHRYSRTVHEQVLYSLESKSHPITYYDLVDDHAVKKTAAEMRQDILVAADALRCRGIMPGDRVALTGLNSSKYLALDIAIGLVGAVSVPLYYTTPPADINQVLQASGAKLFIIGMPSLLLRAGELNSNVPLVSICRGELPEYLAKRIISWRDFTSKSNAKNSQYLAPVGFDDVATLRYSSGTTGKPKGMIFKHSNLRYMAESIVSITPWQARNRPCSYFSFLPMGHVVEGILATYSPYYIPASIEIYFLEDFKKLQKMLPHVKPSIFFSVPRIYERVWEGLEKNLFGKFYLKHRKDIFGRLLRRTVRNMTLKKAGLNKCAQLIAGSARADEDLLQNYRELGVEIYNAYGMTEAPLITINRLNRNRLGTVGEPMPMTEVKIADDGEIMVKGPQVTLGYFDKSIDPPFKDGWLMTGDTGRLTEEGSLVIFGRKKELIKTSYGKCIYTGKIEGMIRELPNVSEAMLVGESKPFCAAVMWVPKNQWSENTLKKIDEGVEEMNKRLSNPEKIKKWAVLVNNLSIENGDLTPNLKLKHNVVSERYTKIINAMYGGEAPEGEIHLAGIKVSE